MKFKITIQQARPRKEDSAYDSFDDIYEQIIEDMDCELVIKAANGFISDGV
jgi:hypothetical protein